MDAFGEISFSSDGGDAETGLDISKVKNRYDRTQLHKFVQEADCNQLVYWIDLLQANVETTAINDGESLLMTAVSTGFPHIVNFLLDRGANVNARDQKGATPLHLASSNGKDCRILRTLLDRGSNIDALDEYGLTPLMYSASGSRSAMGCSAFLINAGADINIKDQRGMTVLHHAAQSGQVEFINMLILMEMPVDDVDHFGYTALHRAALSGKPTIRPLLEIGADINAKDKDGHTPVYLASQHCVKFSVEYLLGKGANISEAVSGLLSRPPDGFGYINTAKSLFIECARQGYVSGMRQIMFREMISLPRSKTGGEAFIAAVTNDHWYVINFLIDHQVAINAQCDKDGMTALHISTLQGNIELMKYLLMKGASPGIKNKNGETPLTIATNAGDGPMIELLNSFVGNDDHITNESMDIADRNLSREMNDLRLPIRFGRADGFEMHGSQRVYNSFQHFGGSSDEDEDANDDL